MRNQIRISQLLCLGVAVICAAALAATTDVFRDSASVHAQDPKPANSSLPMRGNKRPVSIRPWYRYSPDVGYVRYGWKLKLQHIPASNDDFDAFFSRPEVQSKPLQLDGGLAAALGLNKLGKLSNVESIQLDHNSRITDRGLELLKSLPKLKELSIVGSRITNEGMRHLAVHKGLESLDLSSTGIDGEGLVHLKGLSQLRKLNLSLIYMTQPNDALRPISTLKNLRHLVLFHSTVTSEALVHVSGLTKLRTLDLRSTYVTEDGLHHLRSLDRLSVLRISNRKGRRFTNWGIQELKELSQLRVLEGSSWVIPFPPQHLLQHLPQVARQRLITKLASPTEMDFNRTPLKDAVNFLSQHHFKIEIDERALAAQGVTTDSPVSLIASQLQLRSALRLILEPLELDYLVRTDRLLITTQSVAAQQLESQTLDIEDLVSEPQAKRVAKLAQLIPRIVEPESWTTTKGKGTIKADGTRLKVTQTRRVHNQIQSLLQNLKRGTLRLPAEESIVRALDDQTTLECVQTPLLDGFDFIGDLHNITTHLDRREFAVHGVSTDAPLTITAQNVTLEDALLKLLDPLKLSWLIRYETLFITSKDRADRTMVATAYQVGHLTSTNETDQDIAKLLRGKFNFAKKPDWQIGRAHV